MKVVDIFLMILILSGTIYLLYRSLWKKKGHCAGCNSDTCDIKKTPITNFKARRKE
ncbi:FeoB-associated Cys-rich membrane protein [Candidatus Poribacteria bacterium]|nr:FeoB-associated Cys-rich membrane protein [Candidatus Poribacteria bacterium]